MKSTIANRQSQIPRRWSHEQWIRAPRRQGASHGATITKRPASSPQNDPAISGDELPLVLVRSVALRQIIVAVNSSARAQGIRPGMTLSEARAICADVLHDEHDPHRDAVALEALARWMMRFSPTVAPCERFVAATPASHSLTNATKATQASQPQNGLLGYGLFLDVTGCDRIFHGLENLLRLVEESLKKLHITARLAIAPTPGAAWALTTLDMSILPMDPPQADIGCTQPIQQSRQRSFSKEISLARSVESTEYRRSSPSTATTGKMPVPRKTAVTIVSSDQLLQALENLPPIALRIGIETAEVLHHLGLNTIGQVLKLPRESLPARFGNELLLRIDQAMGNIPEPLVPIEPFSPIAARMDFEAPIDSLETIWAVLKELIGKLIMDLTKRGRGAREVQAEFLRAYEEPIVKTINLSRASRDAVNLFNLLRCAMETIGEARRHIGTKARREERAGKGGRVERLLPASLYPHSAPSCLRAFVPLPNYDRTVPDGFIGIKLTVSRSERIDDEQIALLEHEEFAGQIELDHLIERLCARLGENIITQSQSVESHLPEKAWRTGTEAHRHEGTKGKTDSRISLCASVPPCLRAFSIRPLQLLRMPAEILVIVAPSEDKEGGRPVSMNLNGSLHRFDQIAGPERIAGIWWEGHGKTRDYFEVEDQAGKRFWIFRVLNSSRWFLHGRFE